MTTIKQRRSVLTSLPAALTLRGRKVTNKKSCTDKLRRKIQKQQQANEENLTELKSDLKPGRTNQERGGKRQRQEVRCHNKTHESESYKIKQETKTVTTVRPA